MPIYERTPPRDWRGSESTVPSVFFYVRKGSPYGIGAHYVQYLYGLLSSLIQDPKLRETASNKGFSALVALKLRRDSAALPAYHGRIYADMAIVR